MGAHVSALSLGNSYRMAERDAALLGNGFVRITRTESGLVATRLPPEMVLIKLPPKSDAPFAGEGI